MISIRPRIIVGERWIIACGRRIGPAGRRMIAGERRSRAGWRRRRVRGRHCRSKIDQPLDRDPARWRHRLGAGFIGSGRGCRSCSSRCRLTRLRRPARHNDLAEQTLEGIDDLAERPILEPASAYLFEVSAGLGGALGRADRFFKIEGDHHDGITATDGTRYGSARDGGSYSAIVPRSGAGVGEVLSAEPRGAKLFCTSCGSGASPTAPATSSPTERAGARLL